MLDRLRSMHNLNYVHMDVKPDNILLGSGDFGTDAAKDLYLIDFGLSLNLNVTSLPPDAAKTEKRIFQGNLFFSSVERMQGMPPAAKDDIVSLLYSLLFLATGELGYSRKSNFLEIMQDKEDETACSITIGDPRTSFLFLFAKQVFTMDRSKPI